MRTRVRKITRVLSRKGKNKTRIKNKSTGKNQTNRDMWQINKMRAKKD